VDEVDAMNAEHPLELVHCPECGQVASIEWRRKVGGVALLKVRCIARHWFLMPGDGVTRFADPEPCPHPLVTK
jgi:hypothetical protein